MNLFWLNWKITGLFFKKKETGKMFNDKISIADAEAQLEKEIDQRFTLLMKHENMRVEYYAPEKFDPQTPHI
jgi:hypothetical protein